MRAQIEFKKLIKRKDILKSLEKEFNDNKETGRNELFVQYDSNSGCRMCIVDLYAPSMIKLLFTLETSVTFDFLFGDDSVVGTKDELRYSAIILVGYASASQALVASVEHRIKKALGI